MRGEEPIAEPSGPKPYERMNRMDRISGGKRFRAEVQRHGGRRQSRGRGRAGSNDE